MLISKTKSRIRISIRLKRMKMKNLRKKRKMLRKKEGGDSEEEEENQDPAADNFEGGVGAAAQLKVEEAEAEVPPAAKKLKVEHDVSSVEVKMEEAAEVKVEKAEAGSTDKGKGIKVEEDSTAMKAEPDVKTEKEWGPLSYKENPRADKGKGIKVEEATEVKVEKATEVKVEKAEAGEMLKPATTFFYKGLLKVKVGEGLRFVLLKEDALQLTKNLSQYIWVVDSDSDKVYHMKFQELGYCIGGEWEDFVIDKGVQVADEVIFSIHGDGKIYILKC